MNDCNESDLAAEKLTVTIKVGVMDGMRFNVLFNSISVISEDGTLIMIGCVKWNSVYD